MQAAIVEDPVGEVPTGKIRIVCKPEQIATSKLVRQGAAVPPHPQKPGGVTKMHPKT